MLQQFQTAGDTPKAQDPTTTLVAGLLKEILESKGDKRALPLMAPKILADLSSALKKAAAEEYSVTAQLIRNQASEVERYAGPACPIQADRFLLGLEQKFGLITPAREQRHTNTPAFVYRGV